MSMKTRRPSRSDLTNWRIAFLIALAPLGSASIAAAQAVAEAPPAASIAQASTDIQAALAGADPDAIEFHQLVTTLADPFFEGRSADTRGNRLAAEYLEFHFNRLGLEPAFPDANGPTAWLQPFSVPGEVEVKLAKATLISGDSRSELTLGDDFNPLGFSGKGQASAPLAFVGYSIEGGPEGYSSYATGDSLTGKIAVMLRFEPVNEKGESRWSNFSGWSRHAAIMEKVGNAVSRGAAGVIILNPPGVTDPRAKVLETTKATRFGKPAGVPVIMLSPEEAKSLLRFDDRDLMDFRKLADKGGHGIIDLARSVELEIDVERAQMQTHNVGAVIPGKGDLATEAIIVGAHYDHLGYGYVGGSNPANLGKLHAGADDNASGTAGLIMLARYMKERYDALPEGESARSIIFLAFSAEEMGLLGAEYYVKNSSIDSTKITAMINMDMIGRLENNNLEVYGTGTATEFESILPPLFEQSGLTVRSIPSGIGPSDHAAFHRAGLPVLAFFTGIHKDYHTPADVPHKVNADGAVRILKLVAEVTETLATRREALAAVQTTGAQMPGGRGSARVRLGVMPGDYSGSEPGVLVGEVMADTSAAKAGMLKGDRIIRWGGEELADAGSMMQRLRDHKPGDIVEIVVVREGKEITLPVTLQGRGGSE